MMGEPKESSLALVHTAWLLGQACGVNWSTSGLHARLAWKTGLWF